MQSWLRQAWADPVVRVALVVALVATVPAWFIWPGEPLMEAIDALAIAGLLLALWLRAPVGSGGALAAVAVIVAVAGLLAEAAFFLATDERPTAVALIFPAGLLLLLVVAVRERRGAPAS